MMRLFILSVFLLLAQDPAVQPDSGAWKEEREPRSKEKAARMVVSGNILSTEENFEKGQDRGMRLKLRTETGDVHVQLGPRWVKFKNDLNFTNGEPVTIVGLKIQLGKDSGVNAEEIKRQNKTLKLRDVASDRK